MWAEMPWPKSDAAHRSASEVVERAFRPVLADRDTTLEADAAAEVLLTLSWFNKRPDERRRAVAPGKWLAASRESVACAP